MTGLYIHDINRNDITNEIDERGIVIVSSDSPLNLSIPAAPINDGVSVYCTTVAFKKIRSQGIRIQVVDVPSTEGMAQ